ncbi:sulfide-quinone oxidoreductase-like protein [Paraphaeosphaeria sporulosa]|uniref:Sulfide-quinone oxidoreductase-like protein n=1 Tax=Paraphaeosphaeria sporulosa TaxID=1460663 RepID=A0A177CIW5_9PLEO|nr:sulfide-quinone oxidoreductase-like protein [Paraphaeosphaeria sporulosa]OAG07256.1 sulfide-quinone oxidoreductase-like protein [Paraphaeosphaeria sporulosa]
MGASLIQSLPMHPTLQSIRSLATTHAVRNATRSHKIVVVGGGSSGIALSHQFLRKGNFAQDDIAIIDPATWHHYQPGWTLVGGGLKKKEELRRPMESLMHRKFKFYNTTVSEFAPTQNYVTLADGDRISYEQLVVVPGIKVDTDSVKGLSEALADPDAAVSSIYQYEYCDKTFRTIKKFNRGSALFTQPAGIVKCAGAPQKIMWLALDHWKRAGLYHASGKSAINVSFATGLPAMFGVPKYAAKLDELRVERGVEGLFEHDLVAIEGNTAIFARPEQAELKKHFDFLHVAPKNRPHAFVKNSPLANEAGFVDVDDATTRHKFYPNVWSIGDASSLPTSKTVAAITSQAPVLVSNLMQALQGKAPVSTYDGYTSCPLLVGNKEVLLAEFKYGGQPKETFGRLLGIDQAVPRRAFYHLKKDFFPWVYGNFHVNGTWAGPKGFTW